MLIDELIDLSVPIVLHVSTLYVIDCSLIMKYEQMQITKLYYRQKCVEFQFRWSKLFTAPFFYIN